VLERKGKETPKRTVKKLLIRVDEPEQAREEPKTEILDCAEKEELSEQASAQQSKAASRRASDDRSP